MSDKGLLIEKLKNIPKIKRDKFSLEISEIKANSQGVEFYVRAWDKRGNAVSLGTGVEKEHFIVVNPPILVPDKLGDITLSSGLKAREDIKEALLQSVEHTVLLTYKNSAPLQGSVGNTTLTVYPNAGSGGANTSVDGRVERETVDETWANIRSGAGTLQADTNANGSISVIASATSNQYQRMVRFIDTFDISSIPAGATLDSATISVASRGVSPKSDTLLMAPVLTLVEANPAANNALAASDYNIASWGTTSFGGVAYADFSGTDTTYNDITVNASGLTYLDGFKEAVVPLGWRFDDDISNTAPTWDSGALTNMQIYTADQAGTTVDPKLVIVYSTGGATPHLLTLLGVGN